MFKNKTNKKNKTVNKNVNYILWHTGRLATIRLFIVCANNNKRHLKVLLAEMKDVNPVSESTVLSYAPAGDATLNVCQRGLELN